MAAHDLSVFSLRMAMRLNALSLQKTFSMRWPTLQGAIEGAPVDAVFALENDHAGTLRV
ncbi:hypothetical protein GLX_16130 [Komagataeibacter medellinensis NBRC 3288]|uniref:Uncharacterized protein n=1 Tax=Komagataeibacter medellinensis (strain NBRC 3288 / BCRC 11682 / LMG 1693 / Kondo 51) TaxID=634177 RepID=G2I7C8_KOMMN|nr:hypothetical protein GLX_16130 [Komagataeibacter medellinensis NBRC 3288]